MDLVKALKDLAFKLIPKPSKHRGTLLPPQGSEGVHQMGHRIYVGGLWDSMGQHQFDFLVQRGLQPEHVLLDIACGSLRLGVKAIPYLQPGHYLGVEKEPLLLELGIREELGEDLATDKKPRLLQNDQFAFELLATPVDVAIAQSLFTHLPPELIHQCFKQLRPWLKSSGVFYATYFESSKPQKAQSKWAHDHESFFYTRAQMECFGCNNGYTVEYIGDWDHPRQQRMVAYRPCLQPLASP